MASFNTNTTHSPKTRNISGHAAYRYPEKTELLTRVAACMVGERKFYGDTTDATFELATKLAEKDPTFVAKLAVYARNTLMMRSVSHMLASVVAASDAAQGTGIVRAMTRALVRRGDDVTNLIAAWRSFHPDRMVPNGMIKGLRDAMENFTPYDVAKYRELGKAVTMRDALRIVHPRAKTPALADSFDRCVKGTLARPTSWETELASCGNNAETWNRLLAAHQVPPMALVRNLRNIVQAGANLDPVYELLADEAALRRSGMLPFRLYTAYREIRSIAGTKLVRAIDQALGTLALNYPALPGRTAVFIDGSGSMTWHISEKSTVSCSEVAALMGAAAALLADDAYVYIFSGEAQKLEAAPTTSLLGFTENVLAYSHGGLTDLHVPFEELMEDEIDVDRIIVLSDNEVNASHSWNSFSKHGIKACQSDLDAYRAQVGHDVWCHAWDLQGYGSAQFLGAHTNVLAGFSERALEFVAAAEQGFGAMIEAVEKVEL